MKKHYYHHVKGFTLVELLVVLALFTTVLTIASGALFSAQAVNTKLQQTQIVLDGVNLAAEQIVRDVRYGSIFYCTNTLPVAIPNRQSCAYPNGNSVLVFKPINALTVSNSSNDRIAYYLSNGVLYRKAYPEGVEEAPLQMTSDDVAIETLFFYVKGAEDTGVDFIQPVVTLILSGHTKPTKASESPVHFSIQTTISVRKIDN